MENKKNKPSLWVFGDSFSEEMENVPKGNDRWDYINDFLDGIPYPSWAKIISEEIGYNYKNYAAQNSLKTKYISVGNSNESTLNTLSFYSSDFKSNDIVFVGFTEIVRFQYPIDNIDVNVLPQIDEIPNDKPNLGKPFCEKILYHREINKKWYIHALLTKIKLLKELSKERNFHLFLWAWGSDFEQQVIDLNMSDEYWVFHNLKNYFDYVDYFHFLSDRCDNNAMISQETNGKNSDGHTGKIGNEIHAKILLEYFENNLTFK